MCGRYFREEVNWLAYEALLDVAPIPSVEPPPADWNVAPTSIQPVIRRGSEGGRREMVAMRWGLIPHWWNRPLREWRAATFNARSEEVAGKPAFRGAFRHRRCLVPVSGYYEWSRAGPTPVPFAFRLRERRLFCLAGLWETAFIDGSQIDSFTILTTAPNDFTSGIHDRMPVILAPEHYDDWLDPRRGDPVALFRPFANDQMQAWPIGPAVGRVRNNSPDLLREV